ncbi:threonine/homoserine/homoserine lactone efflux protein [Streptacidiphilus sp. MAP12-20]|uniref:LysE family translocator n=1 Tax=Streptacidiphilus sp. MAP12-20 TaxID=3156299 RepID=UPI003512C682
MPPTDRLLAFVALATVIIVIPGPSVLFVLGRALAHGRRTALLSVVGNTLGSLLLVGGIAVGLGPLLAGSALALTVLKLGGAAYLVYLGVKAYRHRGSLAAAFEAVAPADRRAAPRSDLRTLAEGLVVGASNPKTLIFYAAVLPQFVARGHGAAPLPLQLLALGLIFNLIALTCDSAWGLASSAARSWFARSPRRLRAVGGAGGLAMIGLGVTVAATGRTD